MEKVVKETNRGAIRPLGLAMEPYQQSEQSEQSLCWVPWPNSANIGNAPYFTVCD